MDIVISNPIELMLEVIEIDEHLPSLHFDVKIRSNIFCYDCEISSKIWIECCHIDDFIASIKKEDIAILKDFNDCFELRINSIEGWLEWSCSKEDLDGCTTSSKGREKIDIESKLEIYEAFNDFPKWW